MLAATIGVTTHWAVSAVHVFRAAQQGGAGDASSWWAAVVMAAAGVIVGFVGARRAIRRHRELLQQVGRMQDELSRTLADPLLVHQARRRLRQIGDHRPEAA